MHKWALMGSGGGERRSFVHNNMTCWCRRGSSMSVTSFGARSGDDRGTVTSLGALHHGLCLAHLRAKLRSTEGSTKEMG
jgi:hypothetical protein